MPVQEIQFSHARKSFSARQPVLHYNGYLYMDVKALTPK